jgi:hypothetical protein
MYAVSFARDQRLNPLDIDPVLKEVPLKPKARV